MDEVSNTAYGGGGGGGGDALKVTSYKLAKYWTDAYPIGNGNFGAMVWGGVPSELLQLNEDTLYTGGPGDYTDPEALLALPGVRKLIDNGQYADADIAAEKMLGGSSEIYQLLGDLHVEFDHPPYTEASYVRELDLNTATTSVKYSAGNTNFSREYFASYPDKVIAAVFSASEPSSLSFTVFLDSLLDHRSYAQGTNQIVLEGECPGNDHPPTPPAGRNGLIRTSPGLRFCAILDLQTSGETATVTVVEGNKLKVGGASLAVLLLVASSSFDGPLVKPADSKKDPVSMSAKTLVAAKSFSYSELYSRHLSDYQSLFQRVSLHLSKNSTGPKGRSDAGGGDTKSTADRLVSFADDEDPDMVELLFQYGRYLLIACSRPGTEVANLQGIWNNELSPKWNSVRYLNINLQMNYWPSLPCNLAECQEPLFDLIHWLSINGSETAKANYGARGWVTHHKTDLWAKSSPVHSVLVGLFPMGGTWLCTHLWEHYTYTLDKDFLENKAYPLLEGCAYFLVDWLVEGPDGYLETNPSTSPEHHFTAPDGKVASLSYSTTIDMELIRAVFSAVITAAEILGKSDTDLVKDVEKAITRLRPVQIGWDGCILEWAKDFVDPESYHRHLSHLIGLYPGHTISMDKTPDLAKAVEKSLIKRGDSATTWSTIWKIALWANLRNGEHAYSLAKSLFVLVDRDHTPPYRGWYSNLFSSHPPFQIDANLGFPAAIAEMLVQSTRKDLYLLPALPRDKWGSGSAVGLRARGGLTVNVSWDEGLLHEVDVWSDHERTPLERLHYEGSSVAIRIIASHVVHTFNGELRLVKTCRLSDVVAT